jgi:hypothetical protein
MKNMQIPNRNQNYQDITVRELSRQSISQVSKSREACSRRVEPVKSGVNTNCHEPAQACAVVKMADKKKVEKRGNKIAYALWSEA